MRLVHVITALSVGGAEHALYKLLIGGLSQRFDCQVISLSDAGHYGELLRRHGVPVHVLGMRRGRPSPLALWRLRRLVRLIRPDVVQGWMYHGNLAASVARRLAPGRPKVAWNIRQGLDDISKEKRLTRQVIQANRLLSPRVDALLYNSEAARCQHETFGFAGERARVIPNGFDTGALVPNPESRAAMRRSLGLAGGVPVVGHVARFHPMKDHAGFLRAAMAVTTRRPDVRFVLVGRGVSLDHPALHGIVPPSLADRFLCLGERSDVHELVNAMDVFCLSSAWGEGFPNVLGEAMSSGVPCVATDVGASAEIVGDTGLIVTPNHADLLAQALLDMLAKPAAERAALGAAARERVRARYDLPAIVAHYADLYEQLD